jgi:hypothetical protein
MTKSPEAQFREAEEEILRLMQDLRALNLSTAVELLELVLAEVRDQAACANPVCAPVAAPLLRRTH